MATAKTTKKPTASSKKRKESELSLWSKIAATIITAIIALVIVFRM